VESDFNISISIIIREIINKISIIKIITEAPLWLGLYVDVGYEENKIFIIHCLVANSLN
jgi:hypothetical protein